MNKSDIFIFVRETVRIVVTTVILYFCVLITGLGMTYIPVLHVTVDTAIATAGHIASLWLIWSALPVGPVTYWTRRRVEIFAEMSSVQSDAIIAILHHAKENNIDLGEDAKEKLSTFARKAEENAELMTKYNRIEKFRLGGKK